MYIVYFITPAVAFCLPSRGREGYSRWQYPQTDMVYRCVRSSFCRYFACRVTYPIYILSPGSNTYFSRLVSQSTPRIHDRPTVSCPQVKTLPTNVDCYSLLSGTSYQRPPNTVKSITSVEVRLHKSRGNVAAFARTKSNLRV